MHIAIAEAGRRHELETVFLGHCLGGVEALLVPAVICRILGRHDGELLDLGGLDGPGQSERADAGNPHRGRGQEGRAHRCPS
jgi:hypothetical protein